MRASENFLNLQVKAKTMRCPKCGYITFDHLETCTKCKRKIAAMSEQLSGTVFKAEAPAFLQLNVHKPDAGTDASIDLFQENNDIDVEFSLDGKEVVSDNAQVGEEIEFDFMDESQDAPASQGNNDEAEDEFDLDLFAEESVELDMDMGEAEVAEGKDGPQLDFSELDISDLAPPADAEDDLSSAELTLEDPASSPVARSNESAQPSMGIGGELEDLQMDGLDLGMPSLPPAGSATGKKLRPSVKTGTALDGFDIDLGELISAQDK